jgi:hypothetical protein
MHPLRVRAGATRGEVYKCNLRSLMRNGEVSSWWVRVVFGKGARGMGDGSPGCPVFSFPGVFSSPGTEAEGVGCDGGAPGAAAREALRARLPGEMFLGMYTNSVLRSWSITKSTRYRNANCLIT